MTVHHTKHDDMTAPATHNSVDLAIDGPLATITISNPRHHNAMTLNMWQVLPDLVSQADRAPTVRVILIRGAGKTAFVSGADITEFSRLRARGAPARAYDRTNSLAFAAIRNCSKPTIAMIQGACMGGGFGIAAACDLRYATDTSTFAIPAAKLGIGYPVDAVQDIVSAIGGSAARELFYTARTIGAEEALKLGFLNRIFAQDTLEAGALSLADRIARGAPLTLQAAKKAITAAEQPSDLTLQEAKMAAETCFDSLDYEEGVSAFLNKRRANFKGN